MGAKTAQHQVYEPGERINHIRQKTTPGLKKPAARRRLIEHPGEVIQQGRLVARAKPKREAVPFQLLQVGDPADEIVEAESRRAKDGGFGGHGLAIAQEELRGGQNMVNTFGREVDGPPSGRQALRFFE